jgi:hypothetical protein
MKGAIKVGTQRLSSIETKRFIFEPLSAFLKARDVSLANRTVINDIAVIAILGTRSIGKTTLLKQLYDTAPDVSEYLDLSVSIRDSKFEEYFAACKESGKTRILLDEVCKIDKEYEADFVKAVKDYVPHMTFIITGSTQAVVSALSSKICRGIDVELVPIMYAESLAWSLGSSVVNPESAVSNSTISLFEEYLRKGGIVTESLAVQPLSFLSGTVTDTLDSYRSHFSCLRGIDNQTLNNLLAYVVLCQYVFKCKNGSFCQIPSLEKEIRKALGDSYVLLRRICSDKEVRSMLTELCGVLTASGLALPLSVVTSDEISNELTYKGLVHIPQIDTDIPAIVFAYPWFISHFGITDDLLSERHLGMWFENLVLYKLNKCYTFADKYRTPNQLGEIGSPGDELDALYTVRSLSSSRVCGVESKWRPRESISNIRIAGYVKLANRLGLDELALTSTTVNAEEFTTGKLDVPTKIYRCDLLVIGLEAEYMRLVKRNLSGRECMGSSKSVSEIMTELLG